MYIYVCLLFKLLFNICNIPTVDGQAQGEKNPRHNQYSKSELTLNQLPNRTFIFFKGHEYKVQRGYYRYRIPSLNRHCIQN